MTKFFIHFQDTAGQERYRTITTAYYRGAMGFILMYDITNEESFNSVQDWLTQIKTYSWDNAQIILVGNKCDMGDERVISYERGKQLADHLKVQFFETSAKENTNVKVNYVSMKFNVFTFFRSLQYPYCFLRPLHVRFCPISSEVLFTILTNAYLSFTAQAQVGNIIAHG